MIEIKENVPCQPQQETIKALLAPVNICGQAYHLAKALRDNNVYARCFQYTVNHHQYPYDLHVDKRVFLPNERQNIMFDIAKQFIESNYDIIHFFQKTFIFDTKFRDFTGVDLPYFRQAGKKIVFRFTGWDLRREEDNLKWNPYSAFKYGYRLTSYQDDKSRRIWLDYLRAYVDEFIVVDEEMRQFCPEAKIIPRVLPLHEWPYVGVASNTVPLLLHAPTDPHFKGTAFFQKALEELKAEGLKFHYKEVTKVPNEELKALMAKADIYLDQLHLGWYGVAAIEAMALGKPVVNYIREDLEANFGETIPLYNVNVDNLKSKLKILIQDVELRKEIGRKARQFVERHHEPNKAIKNLIEIYQKILPHQQDKRVNNINAALAANSMAWTMLQIKECKNNYNQKIKTIQNSSPIDVTSCRLHEYLAFRIAPTVHRVTKFLDKSKAGKPFVAWMKKVYFNIHNKRIARIKKLKEQQSRQTAGNILLLNSFNHLLPRATLIARSFKKKKYTLFVVNWIRSEDVGSPKENCDEMVAVKLPLIRHQWENIFVLPRLYSAIKKAAKNNTYEIIYCNHVIFLPVALYLAYLSKAKVIYDVSEFYIENFKLKLPRSLKFCAPLLRYIENSLVRYVEAIFTIDSYNRLFETRYKKHAKNVMVLNNVPENNVAIDQDRKIELEKKYNNRQVVLYIGGLSYENGAFITLEAAKAVAKESPDVLFLFIGRFNSDFPESAFHQFIKENELEHHVELISWMPYNDLFCYSSVAKIGLSVYQRNPIYEKVGATNSRKTFSYMKMGIPIIAPAFGQQGRCVKEEQCGLLIDTTNLEELTSNINYLLGHPEEALVMGQNGKKAFQEKYNWQEEEKKIFHLLCADQEI